MTRRRKPDPGLIPHGEFHTAIWLRAVRNPGWYYFLRRRNPNVIRRRAFYGGVDPPLRRLVRFLHRRGIRTTPSCAGHHYGRPEFGRIYAGIEREAALIRSGGLTLHDVQTGRIYRYRDSRYRLPWSLAEFIRRAGAYQRHGVIGLRPGRRKKAKAALLALKLPGVLIRERDGIVFFFVEEAREGGTLRRWQAVTRRVMAVLRP